MKSAILIIQEKKDIDDALTGEAIKNLGLKTHKIKQSGGLLQKIIDANILPGNHTYNFALLTANIENVGDFVDMRYSIGEQGKYPNLNPLSIRNYYENTIKPIFNHLKSSY
jgi:hypothetical protein